MVQSPDRAHWLRLRAGGRGVVMGLGEDRAAGGGEVLGALVAGVVLGGSEVVPVGRGFHAACVDADQAGLGRGRSGVGQELLDGHLGLGVSAFAEVMMAQPPFGVGEVQGGPVVVIEGTPDLVVAVGRDGVADLHLLDGAADVSGIVLEPELGSVHADDHQSLAGVFPGPGPQVGQLAQPVDAGVSPEAGQHDLPGQGGRRQRRRVQPPRRAIERGQLTLDRQPGRGCMQPGGHTPVRSHDNVSLWLDVPARGPGPVPLRVGGGLSTPLKYRSLGQAHSAPRGLVDHAREDGYRACARPAW